MNRRVWAKSVIGLFTLGVASRAEAQQLPPNGLPQPLPAPDSPQGTGVNVRRFGAKGDGVTDDTRALQAAIDHAIYVQKCPLYVPSGRYKISTALHVGYGTSFTSLVIYGDGPRYRGEAGFSGTAILASHVDAPAIAFQGGRGCALRDLSIVGVNKDYLIDANPLQPTSKPTWDDTDGPNWVDPAILAANPHSDSRYAPYAGVAIDPYSGARGCPALC